MKFTRKTYETRNQKILDFVIGFFGFFVFNFILFFATLLAGIDLGHLSGVTARVITFLPLILNILGLIYFAFTRYWIALGALSAFGALLLIVLLLAAVCFAQFGAPYS